ncbi:hypothetical protein DK847_00600 [Aestuariivirga litoralis]|uniref:Uncharacterized protein n=1 Tax=Aestuariivirga litoralis TaxID=2650924 RepID=A0A2W2BRM8_9HYPH|nr:hypothetical protein [Aestuariivirga litoralis]PZF78357.1 hypothetical protein DK847_00600 [Aestuariivirga litoralis]
MRLLFASLILLTVAAPAHAAEVRNYFAPQLDGQRIAACLSDGACGKPAADAFCQSEGYDKAMLFQRERSNSARLIDSDKVCDGDCPTFRQVKCFTVRSDLQVSNAAL